MRLQARARDLLVRRIEWIPACRLHVGGQFSARPSRLKRCSAPRFSSNSVTRAAGVEQFDAALGRRALRIQLHAKTRQHAQKRAVHQHTFRKSMMKCPKPFCISSFKSVLKSGLEAKFARPAILMQAKFFPTNTDKFAGGHGFLDYSLKFMRRRPWRHNLHQRLLQYQRLVQSAGDQPLVATQQHIHGAEPVPPRSIF
jgi:hypothetical protein